MTASSNFVVNLCEGRALILTPDDMQEFPDSLEKLAVQAEAAGEDHVITLRQQKGWSLEMSPIQARNFARLLRREITEYETRLQRAGCHPRAEHSEILHDDKGVPVGIEKKFRFL